jgi:hypothetical protein
MIDVLEELRRADSRIFDRLADGALSPADERTLLAALDDEPGAWRRAAIAFIEAQALRRELAGWQSVAPASGEVRCGSDRAAVASVTLRPVGAVRHATARQLSLAAAVCLAFLVGLLCGLSRPAFQRQDAEGGLAENDPPPAGRSQTRRMDVPPSASGEGRLNRLAADSRQDELGDNKIVLDGTLRLTLAGQSPADDQNVEIPLMRAAGIDPEWLERQESAIPGEVLDAWHKAGHVVTRHEELWPIDLGDGRQMLLPVEQVEVDYASDRSIF